MKRLLLGTLVVLTAVLLINLPSLQAQSQGQGNGADNGNGWAYGRPEWAAATHQDVSQALRDVPGGPVKSTRGEFEVKKTNQNEKPDVDGVVQSIVVAPFAAHVAAGFPGVGANGYAPPDTVGEAGTNYYVQWVNVQFAIFDKTTGTMLPGFPKAGNALWSGFGGDCESHNDGDPIVQYDQLADRWIFTQFAVGRNYSQCVAVSTSGDPTGTYNRYSFGYSDFPDYPKLTVWPDAYYISFNMFRNGSRFTGARVCAYEKAAMMAGLTARQVCGQFNSSVASLLPSDVDGPAPPSGTPNFVLTRGSNALSLYLFKVNWADPNSSTLTGPTNLPVSGFSIACGGGACIPQKGTSQKLDSLGDRLMYRLAYRNLGAAGERLVVNHSVTSGSTTGVRWYELDVTGVGRIAGKSASVRQQSTYAPNDGKYRWMGSIAMDKDGNIAMGYSASSSTTNPAIEWAGRLAGDPANTLSAPAVLWAGSGSQTGGLNRWGDYSTISIDPTDDCTFWFTSETIPVNGSFNWATQFGSFKFPGCGTSPAPATTHPVARPQSR
jgi:hypothetical protein